MAQLLSPYTFTGQTALFEKLTNNTTSANDDFGNTFINQYTLELVHAFPALFSEQTFTLQTFPSQRYYTLPSQIRKIDSVVITVAGSNLTSNSVSAGFNWPVKEAPSIDFWNQINTVNTITSDIPLWYFFYNGQLGIYPMPANGYNPITIRAQAEITSVSQADYTTGTITTVPYTATLTAAPILGATTTTLTGSWTLPTGTYQITFSDSEKILATMTNGSALVALQSSIAGTPNYPVAFTAAPSGTTGTLTTAFALASGTYQITFSDGELINGTFTNSSTSVTFASAPTGTPNASVLLNSSTGGNVVNISTAITIQTGTGGDIVTGSGTSWNASMVGYMFRVAQTQAAGGGDGFPYIVNTVYSTTALALNTPYAGTAITSGSATYTLGQVSIIPTAYQLIPVYRACDLYYTVITKDETRAAMFRGMAEGLFAQMKADYGNKDTNPTVQDDFGIPMINPNLAVNITQSTN